MNKKEVIRGIPKGTREAVQFIASLVVLGLGIALVFISLFLPPIGIINPSVITVFGMFLGFVGAVWNIDLKYAFKTEELRREYHRSRYEKEEENEESLM